LINADNKLSVSGIVKANAALNASWSVYYNNVLQPINSFSLLTPAFAVFNPSSGISSSSVQASFPVSFGSNTFLPGRTYTFQLSANLISFPDLVASSQVSVKINSPPFGGILLVTPSSGEAITTTFLLSMQGWVTDLSNYPLSYSFSYQLSLTTSLLSVGSLSQVANTQSSFPPGFESNNFRIMTYSNVYDSYSAFTLASQVVTVNQLSAAINISSLLSSSANLLSSYDIGAATQSVNNVASVLNSVNCSATPSSYCTSLNREFCDIQPNLCGVCITGYKGAIGYSNTKCFPSNSTAGQIGSECSSNSDCLYGLCNSNFCVEPNKTCSTVDPSLVCSGYGSCHYYDSSSNEIPSCLLTNTNCRAVCACESGNSGSDCSLTTNEIDLRDSARSQL